MYQVYLFKMKNKRVTALTVTLRNLERVGDLLLPIWEIVTVARIVVHIVHWPIIPIIAPVTLSFFKKLFHKVQFLVEHSIIIFNYTEYFKNSNKVSFVFIFLTSLIGFSPFNLLLPNLLGRRRLRVRCR